MSKKIIISQKDNIAAVLEDNKVCEFFVSKGDVLLGDVYLSRVDNILPSIEAAFVDVGMPDKMGFIHTDDIMGKGTLKEKVKPNQKLIVQVIKEPTGHKGPRVTTALSLPGRFLVLLPDEKGINVSKKITSQKERARLKSIVSLLKPVGVGVIVRTEAQGQSDSEIQEDLEILLEKWNSIVNAADSVNPPSLLYRDQDLLYRVIREACDENTDEILVDTPFALHQTTQLIQHWNMQVKVTIHKGNDPLLIATGVHKEILNALNTKVNLPLGGYLFIQPTEALTVIDVNSGKFTSSSNQAETILKTNIQAADEIARQLRLRNIGGMVVIDFIDMASRMDKLALLEHFELALEKDKAKPQVGQLSDLGLVELTRHRQGQSLSEIFTKKCEHCQGHGFTINDLKFATPNAVGENRAKMNKIKGPFNANFSSNNEQVPQKNFKFNKKDKKHFNKNRNQNQDIPQDMDKINEMVDNMIKDVVLDNVNTPDVPEVKVSQVPKEEKTEKPKKQKRGRKIDIKSDNSVSEQKSTDTKPDTKGEITAEAKTDAKEEIKESKKLPRKAKKSTKKALESAKAENIETTNAEAKTTVEKPKRGRKKKVEAEL